MHISCEKCKTRYVVKADSIGSKGRVVKCAKCGHKWRQMPASYEEQKKVKEIPPLSKEAQNVIAANSLPVKTDGATHKVSIWLKYSAICLLVINILLFPAVKRDSLKQYSFMHKLYSAVGLVHDDGLAFSQINVTPKEKYTLTLSGKVTNHADIPISIIGIMVSYFDKDDKKIGDYYIEIDYEFDPDVEQVFDAPIKQVRGNTRKIIIDFDYGNSLERFFY